MECLDTAKKLSVTHIRSQKDDDFFVDRLHHRYTVGALVIFFVIVTTNQYVGDPINCWVPAQFTNSFEAYTNKLCWLQNTYYVDQETDIPDTAEERYKSMLKYYQWIHLIILFQCLLFLVPRVVWRSLNDKCGIEIVNYVDAAIKYETVDQYEKRENIMQFITNHINTFIIAKKVNKSNAKIRYKIKRFFSYLLFWTGKRYGNYLIILYLFCKILYLVNVFGQLFLMTHLLGIENFHLLGFEILSRMAKGNDMISSHYFPKVTHCDFKVRELGTDHQYTVQCVLSINIFTEKIYIILWFWFVILTAVTFVDLLMFLFRHGLASNRYKYIKKHFRVFSATTDDCNDLHKFATKQLKPDVVFVLQILATNVSSLVTSRIVDELWSKYCVEVREKRKQRELEKLLKKNSQQEDDYAASDTDQDLTNNNNDIDINLDIEPNNQSINGMNRIKNLVNRTPISQV